MTGGLQTNTKDGLQYGMMNQKTVFVGTNAAITALSPTYPGQRVMPTDTAALTIDVLYERDVANTVWSTVTSLSTLIINESSEDSTTPVTTDSDATPSTTRRYYAYFVMPTTYTFSIITGIEWSNGATVSGNIYSGVSEVDANPPQNKLVGELAWGGMIAQSGTNVVQRNSNISSFPILGGTICGAWIICSSASARIKEQTGQSSINTNKTNTGGDDKRPVDAGAWTATTTRKYVKVYYRGYN